MQYNEVHYKEVQYNDNSYPTLLYDESISIKVESAVRRSINEYRNWLPSRANKIPTTPGLGTKCWETTFSQRIFRFCSNIKSLKMI